MGEYCLNSSVIGPRHLDLIKLAVVVGLTASPPGVCGWGEGGQQWNSDYCFCRTMVIDRRDKIL